MDLALFYELQYLQRELDVIEKKLKEINASKDLKKFKDEYQRLKEEYLKGEEKLSKNSYQQETRKNEIKNLDFNRKECEDIKFSRETDTVKKLESIEKQIEKLDEKKQLAENDILELMNEADNINSELSETKKRLVFIKKKYLSSKEGSDKAVEKLEEQKSKLCPQIESLIKKTDKEEYELYSRISRAHADPVAIVENRLCGGCMMEVSAMDYEALKSGSQDIRCQSCGRLLYNKKI